MFCCSSDGFGMHSYNYIQCIWKFAEGVNLFLRWLPSFSVLSSHCTHSGYSFIKLRRGHSSYPQLSDTTLLILKQVKSLFIQVVPFPLVDGWWWWCVLGGGGGGVVKMAI